MSRCKKRFWTDEEKREICPQATSPWISVARAARRYAVNANFTSEWLKDPRFLPVGRERNGRWRRIPTRRDWRQRRA